MKKIMDKNDACIIIEKHMKLKSDEISSKEIELNKAIMAQYGDDFFQNQCRLCAIRDDQLRKLK